MLHLGDFSGTKLLHAVRNANPFLLILSVLAILRVLRDSFAAVEGFQQIWGVHFRATIQATCDRRLCGRAAEIARSGLFVVGTADGPRFC